MVLDIQNISKKYSKDNYGLKEFSIHIEKGILGLLGANGAGKSTLLKMIATDSKPTSGVITLNKNNILKDPNYIRRQLGFLPQDFGVYENLNAFEFLEYMGAMKGVGGKTLQLKIAQLLEGLNLTANAKKPIGTYSGGMKQRVGIAQTLLNNPKVILFDEPTVGLDPEERVRFRNLISELANEAIVILSSHIVSDIDTIADTVAILKEGKLIKHGNQNEIIAQVENTVFETIIDSDAFTTFKKDQLIINTTRINGKLNVRYISNNPIPHSLKQTATLEDAYLFLNKKY